MRNTLGEARLLLANSVDGGADPASNRTRDVINSCMLRLWHKVMLSSQMVRHTAPSSNGIIIPPMEIESILGVNRNGMPVRMTGQLTEFCGSGPGSMRPDSGFNRLCVNKGTSPTYYDLPGNVKLTAFSDNPADNGLVMQLRGKGGKAFQTTLVGSFTSPIPGSTAVATVLDASGLQVNQRCLLTGGGNYLIQSAVGTALTLLNDQNFPAAITVTAVTVYGNIQYLPCNDALTIGVGATTYTANFYTPKGVSYLQKPVTQGNVFLYAYDPSSPPGANTWLISIYQPNETMPEYTRYLIPGMQGYTGAVEILGKKRFIPVVNDSDELPISNIPALQIMCQALYQESKENFTVRDNEIAKAVAELEMADRSAVGGEMPMMGVKFYGLTANVW